MLDLETLVHHRDRKPKRQNHSHAVCNAMGSDTPDDEPGTPYAYAQAGPARHLSAQALYRSRSLSSASVDEVGISARD
jgi:hypothetical protein